MVKVWLLSLAVVFGAAVAANGQEAEAAPSPYFDCPYINYFDSDCPQLRELWQEREQRRLQEQGGPAATPGVEQEPGQTGVHVGQDEGVPDALDLEKALPAFPEGQHGAGRAGFVPAAAGQAVAGNRPALRALVRAAHGAHARGRGTHPVGWRRT